VTLSNLNSGEHDQKEIPLWKYRSWELTPRKIPVNFGVIPWSEKSLGLAFYSTYTAWREHERRIICNCQGGQNAVPCVVCYYASKMQRIELIPQRRIAVTVIIPGVFHNVEKDGSWTQVLCSGENCRRCQAGAMQIHGLRRYLRLPPEQYGVLTDKYRTTLTSCVSCGVGYVHNGVCMHDNGQGGWWAGCNSPKSQPAARNWVYTLGVDGSITGPEYSPIAFTAVPLWLREPLPLPEFLLFEEPAEQAKSLGLKNPFGAQENQVFFREKTRILEETFADFIRSYRA